MQEARVFQLIFSSSATVYGEVDQVSFKESMPTGKSANPYGRSKLMVEEQLADLARSDERWRIGVLRYFNPVGAHESGQIGEDPRGTPNNLMPFISQVAVGRLETLQVFGNDYPTPDGTGVRDYIHVMDLAQGHLKALEAVANRNGWHVWNLGTGRGHSVLEMVHAFERVSGCSIPYQFAPRRPGDIAQYWADPTKAKQELGWQAERDLAAMVTDS